ncbi:3'-5' exonuclease [Vibrio salinus]|uniref:3'-5' exonuclease n=1 Tax=Vibrio salinus TaxID=2899784 RepID=UPI001E2B9D6F|nr:3'-5' exonuclease [Vibrio salinus]MCE0492597.1 3'-5' exonuclease [Vibrio salinus]
MSFLKLFTPPSIDWPNKFQTREERAEHPLLKKYYHYGLPDPATPIGDIEFLAIDLETTGLNSNKDEIISIGAVPFTLNRICLNRAKEWIVKPKRKLAEESIVIHGITHSDIENAPDLITVLPELLEMMTHKIMVVHFLDIERFFLDKAFKSRLDEGIEFPLIDTMKIEQRVLKKNQRVFFNLFNSTKKISTRLALSRRRYGLPNYPPHHALTDAIATAELLQAQISHYYHPTQPISHFWL